MSWTISAFSEFGDAATSLTWRGTCREKARRMAGIAILEAKRGVALNAGAPRTCGDQRVANLGRTQEGWRLMQDSTPLRRVTRKAAVE